MPTNPGRVSSWRSSLGRPAALAAVLSFASRASAQGAANASFQEDAVEQCVVGGLDSDVTRDETGKSQTVSPAPINLSAANPFFEDFGSNGRTCGTCHVEKQGWTITPEGVGKLKKKDPLFLFDGSDCLPAGVANPDPETHSIEMRSKALVRIDLPIPAGADFTLVSYSDPHHCPTAPSAADLRMYRRPLPTSNTAFLSTVMWDGRENVAATIPADLAHQANDATLGHAQAAAPLPATPQAQIVAFETGLFNAQLAVDGLALDSNGATGGGLFLFSTALPAFSIGVNDPLKPGFSSVVFHPFEAWEPQNFVPSRHDRRGDAQRAQIGRGERLFNTRSFTIDGVAGLNQDPSDPIAGPFVGFCGTCHNTPEVGDHSSSLPLDIGITDVQPVGGLDVSGLPVYTFEETATGRTISVTDPGRGLISGHFKDVGKTKGPILRNLAARAPYFHNGSAADLAAAVSFYNLRFHIGLTASEIDDLVAFLGAL
jgi:cytochrome c peroxidase